MRNLSRELANEVNAGSMADIAFLLLIFFLVTTTISTDKGLGMRLPPKETPKVPLNERNVLNILVNSKGELLADNQEIPLSALRVTLKTFINNNNVNSKLSESPQKAVVSIKTARELPYEDYIAVLDLVKLSFAELRASYLKLSLQEYRQLNPKELGDKARLERAKAAYPVRISDAIPFTTSQ